MRRIGSTPNERGSTGYNNCPDVIELDDGEFLAIGKITLDSDDRFNVQRLMQLGASIGTYCGGWSESAWPSRRCNCGTWSGTWA